MANKRWEVLAADDPDDDTLEPITFTLGTETFRCVTPEMPGASMAYIGRSTTTPIQDVIAFLGSVVVPEDEDRLHDAIRSKNPIVPGPVLAEVMSWLISVYGGRPFRGSSTSSNGPPTTPPSSEVDSPSPAAASAI